MTRTPPTNDPLDGLLSDFFKAEMKKPWPAAPAVSAEAPRNQPAVAVSRDAGNRARYTLAASVAPLLGTCWTLSNGLQPGERSGAGTTSPPAGDPLNMDSFGASDPAVGKELRKDKAEKGDNGNNVFDPTKMDPFK